MVEIFLSNPGGLERDLRNIIKKKTNQVITDLEKFLVKQNELLGEQFLRSSEFASLKSSLQGEFGFTDSEILALDGIVDIMKSDENVTRIKATKNKVVLEWVDFKALKGHPKALHPLTKFNAESNAFEVTQVVSWIDWLENGLTVTGFVFEDGGGKFSRSGDGRMVKGGGLFRLPQTRVLEKIAKTINKKEITRGIAVILARKVT